MSVMIASPIAETERIRARDSAGGACVRCGCTIFAFCRLAAEPAGPAFLLCPDCIERINAGRIPSDVILRITEDPIARHPSFDRARFLFPRNGELPEITFPNGAIMTGTFCPLAVSGAPVLSFSPENRPGWPSTMNLALGTGDDEPRRLIASNQWLRPDDRWTFSRTGSLYRIEDRHGKAWLTFTCRRGGGLHIQALRTWSRNHLLTIDAAVATLDGEPITVPSAHMQLVGLNL